MSNATGDFFTREHVLVSHAFMLVAVIMFVDPGTVRQVLVALFVSLGFALLGTWCEPYFESSANLFKMATEAAMLVTLTLAILLRFDLTSADDSLDATQLGILMVAANIFLPLLAILWEARDRFYSKAQPPKIGLDAMAGAEPDNTVDNPIASSLGPELATFDIERDTGGSVVSKLRSSLRSSQSQQGDGTEAFMTAKEPSRPPPNALLVQSSGAASKHLRSSLPDLPKGGKPAAEPSRPPPWSTNSESGDSHVFSPVTSGDTYGEEEGRTDSMFYSVDEGAGGASDNTDFQTSDDGIEARLEAKLTASDPDNVEFMMSSVDDETMI